MVNGPSFIKRQEYGKLFEPQGKRRNAGIAPDLSKPESRQEQ
jgi:hypothetical protein